ncbi:T9SS type A sorting domain-containing protein, partial [bacterium]|nr:T9SS type A sorting domain-containing protein [bacterium]
MQNIVTILLLLACTQIALPQSWTGPFNPTGDTLIVDPVPIADTEDNIHLIFDLPVGSLMEFFHMKYSPYGEVLIPPHQLTSSHLAGTNIFGIYLRETPFIDMTSYNVYLDSLGHHAERIIALRFDYNGVLIEPPYELLELPLDWETVYGCAISMDSELRYHILYSTYGYPIWPAVVYARTSRQGQLEVGPDTIAYEQPYYHAYLSSAVNSANQFLAVWSNIDGWDQYLQAAVIDSDGTVLVEPFNPLPDTTHLAGAGGRLRINDRDQVVMQYATNPPGPVTGRIDLYLFDNSFNVIDCTCVVEDFNGSHGAWGDWDVGANTYDRVLNVYETSVLIEDDRWEHRTYTKAYDFELNLIGEQDSLDVSSIDSQGNLSVLCASGFEAVWMTASPVTDPYSRLFSWHRIVNPDCLAVSGYRPVRPMTVLTPHVWPNPSNGVVNLSFPANISGPVDITIFNILGQHVYSLSEARNPQGIMLKFDLPLPSGNYFISAHESKRYYT